MSHKFAPNRSLPLVDQEGLQTSSTSAFFESLPNRVEKVPLVSSADALAAGPSYLTSQIQSLVDLANQNKATLNQLLLELTKAEVMNG